MLEIQNDCTVYPKKYAHGFVVLCFVVVMQSFIMNSHEVFIPIHQGCFAGTEAIVRLPQCQWSKPDGHGKISQCLTTTKHNKAKTVCIFLGIYCMLKWDERNMLINIRSFVCLHTIMIHQSRYWSSSHTIICRVPQHCQTAYKRTAYNCCILCTIPDWCTCHET